MGLMDQLGQAAGGMFGTGTCNADPMTQIMVGMMTKDSAVGGLDGLVESFRRNGLSEVVDSWVGTGQNLPITPGQIQQGLGADVLHHLATSAGTSSDQLSTTLAQLLPDMVDKLTPGGTIPDAELLKQELSRLGKK